MLGYRVGTIVTWNAAIVTASEASSSRYAPVHSSLACDDEQSSSDACGTSVCHHVLASCDVSQRRAFKVVRLHRSTQRLAPPPVIDDEAELRASVGSALGSW